MSACDYIILFPADQDRANFKPNSYGTFYVQQMK